MTSGNSGETESQVAQERAGHALLERYLAGVRLNAVELGALANHLFRVDLDTYDDRLEDVLSDAPEIHGHGVLAPRLAATVLRQLRERLSAQGSLTEADKGVFNQCRERLAVCTCLDDSKPRKRRLLEAWAILGGADPRHELGRPGTLRWLAAIGRQLVVDFRVDRETGMEPILQLTYRALRLLAPLEPMAKRRLQHLGDYCEFYLRWLCARSAVGEDQGASEMRWAEEPAKMFDAFRGSEDPSEEPRIQEFHLCACNLLEQTMLARDRDPSPFAARCVEASADIRIESVDESLELVFSGIIRIVRWRARLGSPVPNQARGALRLILQALLQHRLEQERTSKTLLKRDWTALETLEALPELDPISGEAVDGYIDDLLSAESEKRTGIALSGGGFRAALFHLGVLAHLAECDELRRVDILSCVSGGSITGAALAARTQVLLATKLDIDITAEDYIDVVSDLIATLSRLASSNVRMRALANPWFVLRMWLQPGYTYTERIAELIDTDLLLALTRKHPCLAGLGSDELVRLCKSDKRMSRPGTFGAVERALDWTRRLGWPLGPWDLAAAPRGEGDDFATNGRANSLRRSKCPELVLNATSVNTGAAFMFSTRAHGERPDPHASEISSRPRMPWMPYGEVTTGAFFSPHPLRLSRGVAASASVPGLIPPVLLERVKQDVLLTLADGGVVDNQGLHVLLEAGCDRILVSDASGQLGFQAFPDSTNLPVIMRASDIMMERVRELGYKRVLDSNQGGSRIEVAHIHLTRELAESPPMAAFRPDDAIEHQWSQLRDRTQTSFGVNRHVQRLLAELRTDLDCFCEVEAKCLMLDGYLQAKAAWPSAKASARVGDVAWPFLSAASVLAPYQPNSQAAQLLRIGAHRFFRLPRLLWNVLVAARLPHPGIARALASALALASSAVLLYLAWWCARAGIGNDSAAAAAAAASVAVVLSVILPPGPIKRWFAKVLSGPGLLLAMAYAWGTIVVADPIYRWLGRWPRNDS